MVWKDVRDYQEITIDNCPDVLGKFLLVFMRGSAEGIVIRLNVLTEYVEGVFSAEFCLINK